MRRMTSPRRARQRLTLPVAFSCCVADRHAVAEVGAREHHSLAGAYVTFAVLSGVALLERSTPQSYAEAMMCKKRNEWVLAMKAEYEGCERQRTWELVRRADLSAGTNIIPVKWVFKIKTDETGAITKYKARITPKGFKQKHGVDYFEVFANTGKYKTLRVVLCIAASRDMELRQLDVPQAFTQAELEEDVYMEMPQGFEVDGMVCRLKKSLYGLKQSPRNWYLLASTFIVSELDFCATVSDPCLFHRRSRTGQLILLFLFVDDMQVAFDKADEDEWAEAHAKLRERFNITDLGESRFMLGMRITRDRSAQTIKLDQELYVTKALEKFGLAQCAPSQTPGVSSSSDDDQESKEQDQPTDLKVYQEKVGTLLYAAISTRPDIAYAVNKLTQRMQAPKVRDARACDRVFRYLSGTRAMGLLFGRRARTDGGYESRVAVDAYADSDWASDRVDRKSITGWIARINGDPVSWASKKQKVVSLSTCEAELYAEAAAINETKWLCGLLKEIGLKSSVPIVYGDNQSAQALSKNGIKSERTKHVAIKYAFIYDEVTKGRVQLQWVPTKDQLADTLTKALGAPQHRTLVDQLMAVVGAKRRNEDRCADRMRADDVRSPTTRSSGAGTVRDRNRKGQEPTTSRVFASEAAVCAAPSATPLIRAVSN